MLSNNIHLTFFLDIEIELCESIETVSIVDEPTASNKPYEIVDSSTQLQPSAPQIQTTSDKPVQYPNLDRLIATEQLLSTPIQSQTSTKSLNKLKPFTAEQMKELYFNPQIRLAQQFENDFITTELGTDYTKYYLYELLTKYLNSRCNLRRNDGELKNFNKVIESQRDDLWTYEKKYLKYSATCMDGNVVSATETYDYVTINEQKFESFSKILSERLNLVCYNYTRNLYASKSLHIQVCILLNIDLSLRFKLKT